MTHDFELLLKPDEIDMLRTLKGTFLYEIGTRDIGNSSWCFGMVFDTDKTTINITTLVDNYEDKDEYPCLKVDDGFFDRRLTLCQVNSVIKDIFLITDEVYWEDIGKAWHVKADIGFRIDFESGKSMRIQVLDSLAGFIHYELADTPEDLHYDDLDRQWKMKTMSLGSKQRTMKRL
jgi:hypothetical protein